MSFIAIKQAAEKCGLDPNAKLLLLQIAYFHNHETDQCNPGPERLASLTGMSAPQVRRVARHLVDQGHLTATRAGFTFPDLKRGTGLPIPPDWWPSQDTLKAIARDYPTHHFDMQEAVDDFTTFAASRSLKYQPNGIDAAFRRNLETLLDNRGPGPIAFAGRSAGARSGSVGALLSGRR